MVRFLIIARGLARHYHEHARASTSFRSDNWFSSAPDPERAGRGAVVKCDGIPPMADRAPAEMATNPHVPAHHVLVQRGATRPAELAKFFESG